MSVAIAVLTVAVVLVFALLAAASAGVLTRIDGATWPTALTRSAIAFAAVITLAAAVTAALAPLLV
ncbi:hypothetical protein CTU88_11305 [Streptomyces sp. JV178]|uniref:hypothetical protein n=1 Tax=Streptomyces sp. JV178 TaxID=858632 RepID=UPI000C1B48E5|nr:hypothetical protein [Streptomyces sp. JV178]PIM72694.1 hypothetical protein CTU88_11305 [Streptomyces sp. JV178]